MQVQQEAVQQASQRHTKTDLPVWEDTPRSVLGNTRQRFKAGEATARLGVRLIFGGRAGWVELEGGIGGGRECSFSLGVGLGALWRLSC